MNSDLWKEFLERSSPDYNDMGLPQLIAAITHVANFIDQLQKRPNHPEHILITKILIFSELNNIIISGPGAQCLDTYDPKNIKIAYSIEDHINSQGKYKVGTVLDETSPDGIGMRTETSTSFKTLEGIGKDVMDSILTVLPQQYHKDLEDFVKGSQPSASTDVPRPQ